MEGIWITEWWWGERVDGKGKFGELSLLGKRMRGVCKVY